MVLEPRAVLVEVAMVQGRMEAAKTQQDQAAEAAAVPQLIILTVATVLMASSFSALQRPVEAAPIR